MVHVFEKIFINFFELSFIFILIFNFVKSFEPSYYCKFTCKNNGSLIEHIACQRKNQECGLGPLCKNIFDSSPLTAQEREEILRTHNEYRNQVANGKILGVSVPEASNMNILEYNLELEYLASCIVNQCNLGTEECLITDEFGNIGKNFGSATFPNNLTNLTPIFKRVIRKWTENVKNLNASIIKNFQPNQRVDNFTQLAWAEIQFLGCAKIIFALNETKKMSFVCNYAGHNVTNNKQNSTVYKVGKACSECPDKASCTDKNLTLLCTNRKPDQIFEGLTTTGNNQEDSNRIQSTEGFQHTSIDIFQQKLILLTRNNRQATYRGNSQDSFQSSSQERNFHENPQGNLQQNSEVHFLSDQKSFQQNTESFQQSSKGLILTPQQKSENLPRKDRQANYQENFQETQVNNFQQNQLGNFQQNQEGFQSNSESNYRQNPEGFQQNSESFQQNPQRNFQQNEGNFKNQEIHYLENQQPNSPENKQNNFQHYQQSIFSPNPDNLLGNYPKQSLPDVPQSQEGNFQQNQQNEMQMYQMNSGQQQDLQPSPQQIYNQNFNQPDINQPNILPIKLDTPEQDQLTQQSQRSESFDSQIEESVDIDQTAEASREIAFKPKDQVEIFEFTDREVVITKKPLPTFYSKVSRLSSYMKKSTIFRKTSATPLLPKESTPRPKSKTTKKKSKPPSKAPRKKSTHLKIQIIPKPDTKDKISRKYPTIEERLLQKLKSLPEEKFYRFYGNIPYIAVLRGKNMLNLKYLRDPKYRMADDVRKGITISAKLRNKWRRKKKFKKIKFRKGKKKLEKQLFGKQNIDPIHEGLEGPERQDADTTSAEKPEEKPEEKTEAATEAESGDEDDEGEEEDDDDDEGEEGGGEEGGEEGGGSEDNEEGGDDGNDSDKSNDDDDPTWSDFPLIYWDKLEEVPKYYELTVRSIHDQFEWPDVFYIRKPWQTAQANRMSKIICLYYFVMILIFLI